jgi:hypothetical protein
MQWNSSACRFWIDKGKLLGNDAADRCIPLILLIAQALTAYKTANNTIIIAPRATTAETARLIAKHTAIHANCWVKKNFC